MSLIDDIRAHYKGESYPPDGPDLDYDLVENKWVKRADGAETELVSSEDHSELRWGTSFENVYRRGDEYVAVSDVRPATEMQDWGDYGEPDIYEVKPVTEVITVTKYEKV